MITIPEFPNYCVNETSLFRKSWEKLIKVATGADTKYQLKYKSRCVRYTLEELHIKSGHASILIVPEPEPNKPQNPLYLLPLDVRAAIREEFFGGTAFHYLCQKNHVEPIQMREFLGIRVHSAKGNHS